MKHVEEEEDTIQYLSTDTRFTWRGLVFLVCYRYKHTRRREEGGLVFRYAGVHVEWRRRRQPPSRSEINKSKLVGSSDSEPVPARSRFGSMGRLLRLLLSGGEHVVKRVVADALPALKQLVSVRRPVLSVIGNR